MQKLRLNFLEKKYGVVTIHEGRKVKPATCIFYVFLPSSVFMILLEIPLAVVLNETNRGKVELS